MVSHPDHFPRNPERAEAHHRKAEQESEGTVFCDEGVSKRRCGMSILFSCKEVGTDCNFVICHIE